MFNDTNTSLKLRTGLCFPLCSIPSPFNNSLYTLTEEIRCWTEDLDCKKANFSPGLFYYEPSMWLSIVLLNYEIPSLKKTHF